MRTIRPIEYTGNNDDLSRLDWLRNHIGKWRYRRYYGGSYWSLEEFSSGIFEFGWSITRKGYCFRSMGRCYRSA